MDAPKPKLRWLSPAPAWLVYGSLATTAILFLSQRWRWFAFNEHKGWTVLIAVAGVGVVLLLMLAWFLVALIFRRQFQFSIRSLLVLTVAVALPFSWLGVEIKRAREQKEAAAALETEMRTLSLTMTELREEPSEATGTHPNRSGVTEHLRDSVLPGCR